MQKQIQYAGEFFIKELKIHTSSGRVLDFTESDNVLGFEIYEDIYATSLTGSMLLVDVDNISENGPIIGQEFLTLIDLVYYCNIHFAFLFQHLRL